MRNINFDSRIDLRQWYTGDSESNSQQLERLAERLPQAIDRELTERQRQVVMLHFYENMGTTQIARQLQISPSTVTRTLQRATQRLQRVLRYTL